MKTTFTSRLTSSGPTSAAIDVLTAAAAVCLVVALAIDVSRAGSPTLGALAFTAAGIVLLLIAAIFPHSGRRLPVSREPHFGRTRLGLPVHARMLDHHAAPPGSRWPARFNAWLAVKISRAVGSMWCAYIFALLALLSLPAVLTAAGYTHFFPRWLVAAGLIALVAWIAQTFLQLVLLSVIMVGQGVMGQASDARSAKTFEDVEAVRVDLTTTLDRLDEKTEGGIKAVLDAVEALADRMPKAAPAKRLATKAERGKEGSGM